MNRFILTSKFYFINRYCDISEFYNIFVLLKCYILRYLKKKMSGKSFNSQDMGPDHIRNVCILAHVDHGKTTISDSLLSLNGLVSRKSAGTIRFLDNRQDEQERGITMKSSAVLLVDQLTESDGVENNTPVILNLIDTPGHIDFSTEVTAAVRLCDCAIIVVDVVEGVCAQTRDAIKHSYDERLEMILVVNKIDRLILDLKLTSIEMFFSIIRSIEDCNAFIASLNHLEMSSAEHDVENKESEGAYFSPELGNVIFASALDGWGFTLEDIAKIYLPVIKNEDLQSLTKKLWNFDCFVNFKTKTIKVGAIEKNKTNIFVQLVTSMFHNIYTKIIIEGNLAELDGLITKLNIKDVPSHIGHGDSKSKLKVMLQAWKPLSRVILKHCFIHLPSPVNLRDDRFTYLLNSDRLLLSPNVTKLTEEIVGVLRKCSKTERTIAYVSKKIAIETTCSSGAPSDDSLNVPEVTQKTFEIISITRIFSGKIYVGQELFVLNYNSDANSFIDSVSEGTDAEKYEKNYRKVTISGLYVLCGRKYEHVNCVNAGYICGIVGLDAEFERTATLTDTLPMLPIIDRNAIEPILCNVITPAHQSNFAQLIQSLKLLEQTDSGVRVSLNKSGEYMIFTAGEVHLEKCLEDMRDRLGGTLFNISPPIYSLRETVDPDADGEVYSFKLSISEKNELTIKATVVPITQSIVEVIRSNSELLATIQDDKMPSIVDIRERYNAGKLRSLEIKQFENQSSVNKALNRLKENLQQAFGKSNGNWNTENVLSVSDANGNVNLLMNCVPNYTCHIFTNPDEHDVRILFHKFLINGFRKIIKSGPLCEEPLMNCAFVINALDLNCDYTTLLSEDGELGNGLLKSFNIFYRDTFMAQNPVLMEPMLSTNIQTDAFGLGKLYSEVHKRNGKILDNLDLDENHRTFVVKAVLPALECKDFANTIRRISSGGANPSLEFSHYQIVSTDFSKLELSDDSDEEEEEIELETRTQKLQKLTRRRKGLPILEQIVLHAEKQRTLKK